MTCHCNEAYKCPKCETCFRCKHRSYFGTNGWFWICPRRIKGPWRAHPSIEPIPISVAGTDISPVGVYGGIVQ